MTIITGGMLGPLLLTGGLASGTAPLPPPFYTDPDAARVVAFIIANPASFYTDPNAARELTQ